MKDKQNYIISIVYLNELNETKVCVKHIECRDVENAAYMYARYGFLNSEETKFRDYYPAHRILRIRYWKAEETEMSEAEYLHKASSLLKG